MCQLCSKHPKDRPKYLKSKTKCNEEQNQWTLAKKLLEQQLAVSKEHFIHAPDNFKLKIADKLSGIGYLLKLLLAHEPRPKSKSKAKVKVKSTVK